MRVLFLLTQDLESPSGGGRYFPLAKALAERGHELRIAALDSHWDSQPHKTFSREGVRVEYVAPMHVRKSGNQKLYYSAAGLLWVAIRATAALCNAATRQRVDIIHICKPHPMNSLAGLLASCLGRGILCLDCDDFEAGSNRFAAGWQQAGVAFFERRVPRRAKLVTTNTHFMAEKLQSWGVPADHLLYLPNGVDLHRFTSPDPVRVQALRSQLDLIGKRVVLYIGSLSLPSHPVNLLLEAFQHVLGAMPEAALVVVGGGEDYQTLVNLSHELRIEKGIRFTGKVEPGLVPEFYALAEVSIDPVYDNDAARGRSPLKLFESWTCGVPFVTAAVGDRPALIGQPPAGMLAEPAGDAGALARAILNILHKPGLAEQLRQRGSERVQGYSWEALAARLEEAYLDLR
jgi:glycosyltransferase involved in cell wall biosynthesis